MNLTPYRTAVLLPMFATRAINRKLYSYWREYVAMYCFPVFEVHAHYLGPFGEWAPYGALLLCSPTEHLTLDHCSRMSFPVSVPGGVESTRPYFIDPVRQEVQRRGASFREETVALEDAGAFLAGLTGARCRAIHPMRHYLDKANSIALFPLHPHDTADARRRNRSMQIQLEWLRKTYFRKEALSVLWVGAPLGDMAPYGAIAFMMRGTRRRPMPLNRESLAPFMDLARETDTARGVYFLHRERGNPAGFRLADTVPVTAPCPIPASVPDIPRLLAGGNPHRYLCTMNTPHFGMPGLRNRAHIPWARLADDARAYLGIFSAGTPV